MISVDIKSLLGRLNPYCTRSLEAAAGMIGRSASTVTRIFKKVTGQSFKQYLVGQRLGMAAMQLKSRPNAPVTEIAISVGYDDPLYFSRLYSRTVGRSPRAYRASIRRD